MKIAQVSKLCGLSTDTLRYYERVGLLPSVNRNKSGIRDYSELDIRRVNFIKCMRNAGLPIEVLTEYMQLALQGEGTIEARRNILQEQRDQVAVQLAEIQATFELLNYKIKMYEDRLLEREKELTQMDVFDIEKEPAVSH